MKVFTNQKKFKPTTDIAMFNVFLKLKTNFNGQFQFYYNTVRKSFINYCQNYDIDFVQLTQYDNSIETDFLSNVHKQLYLKIKKQYLLQLFKKYQYVFIVMGDLLIKKKLNDVRKHIKNNDLILPQKNTTLNISNFGLLTNQNYKQFQVLMHQPYKQISKTNKEIIKFYKNFQFPATWMASPFIYNEKVAKNWISEQINKHWNGNDFYFHLCDFYKNKQNYKTNFISQLNICQMNGIILNIIDNLQKQSKTLNQYSILKFILKNDFQKLIKLDYFNFFHFIDCGKHNPKINRLTGLLINQIKNNFKNLFW